MAEALGAEHLTELERALAASTPGSAAWRDAAYAIGAVLVADHRVRDLDRAVALLEEVPDRAEACYLLGEAQAMRGDLDAAEQAWHRALELDPDHPNVRAVLRNLPLDRLHVAGTAQARVEVVERVSEGERDAELWLAYGDALTELDRGEEAARAWERAMALAPLKGMRRRFRSLGRELPT